MANLRIVSITVVDSSNITAVFTEPLSEDISIGNITITSQTPGVANSIPIIASVNGSSLNILTQPLIPYAAYFITFVSTSTVIFGSLNGDASIPNDNVANRQLILGPALPNDPIVNYFNQFFANNVYSTDEPSIVSQYLRGLGQSISECLYDIRQAGNENYLSFLVTDEQETRGGGPYDRLTEESAYEVLRVGTTPTGTNLLASTNNVNPFPIYPVSLIATPNSEILLPSSLDTKGTFNLDDFTLNLSKFPVIILQSVIFVYNSAVNPYTYDIQTLGYQILNSEYDPNYASGYDMLTSNQIKLNAQVLNDPNFSTDNIANVRVSYQFKNNGKVVDASTLSIDTIIAATREIVPPVENIFTLMHAPIVNSDDTLGSVGSIVFIDPNALPGSNTPHPAFLYEMPFSLNYLPSVPGQYSVDYSTGNVYVFGQDSAQTGTGPYPPLASYLYRYVFRPNVDYVYDIDTLDLIALPLGNLLNSSANISYSYELVLVQGIDYQADIHIEALNENVDNRLLALNVIQPLNFPVTDVFRILNETTGEIYNVLRWNNNKIYFTYNQPPNIELETEERANFQDILNETLFVNTILTTSTPTTNIYQFFLNNNQIISASQDCIGSSINTSAQFSNTSVFVQELYFDNNLTDAQNIARLTTVGDYMVDYTNGVVWCLTLTGQSTSVGTISYKRGYIKTQFPHIITVQDIYYQINVLGQKVKQFPFVRFTDTTVLPSYFDVSNEEFLNANTGYPYLLFGGQIGTFGVGDVFIPGVSGSIKALRGIFEYEDLLYNTTPINFAASSTFSGNTITVSPLTFQEYHAVQFDGSNYYILLNTALLYQSPNITIGINLLRLTDNANLWSTPGTIIPGNPIKLIINPANSPHIGDPVFATYSYTINSLSRMVADYNRGDYYIDYTYLADQISVSYEYGDNVLDFSQSNALNVGQTYYATYRAGALRNALLKNFGTLINIPILNDIDTAFAREDYRNALIAAMQSFTAGPTIASIANIVSTIVKTPPQIIESAFQNWTLGQSTLNLEPIATQGEFQLVPAKFGNGVVVDDPEQTITFPISSNLRLEDGSLECWVIPQWNGIDIQSDITISVMKDGAPLPPQSIFIGPGGYHPTSSSPTLNTNDVLFGKPNEHRDGVFIYYAPDVSGIFNRWYLDVLDGYADGYAIKNYSISISTTGKFYDVKSTVIPQPASSSISSGTNTVNFTINGSIDPMQGITFVADNPHYIFDFGSNHNCNRFSLFKDESGYINFRVIDTNRNVYNVSADISSWAAGQQHLVAAAWSIGSVVKRDELHLFIDGQEVPNIIKYGSKVAPYLHEKYRTVDPEEVVGVITRPIVGYVDMTTTAGSSHVNSFLNFTALGILPGDKLYIEEAGFSQAGYTILTVNGQTLVLTTTLPVSTTNATYTVNKTSFDVLTEIDLYPNIAVSLLHVFVPTNTNIPLTVSDLQVISGNATVSSTSINFTNAGVLPGFLISITGSEFPPTYTIVSVNGHSLTLTDPMPANVVNATFSVYQNNPVEIPGQRALNPSYEISRTSNAQSDVVLTITNSAEINDIVLIDTLGMNNRLINSSYYIWADGYAPSSNVIMTRLPPPILLSDVKITHGLLPFTNIGPQNSTLIGGQFVSAPIFIAQPSISSSGRTLSVYISGDNIDYSSPITVAITGTVNGVPNTTETLTFTSNTTQSTINRFEFVPGVYPSVVVSCTPINSALNCAVLAIEELNSITVPENNSSVYPIIRYSYQMNVGNTLISTATNVVSDPNVFFSVEDIGNYLIIISPPSAAGQYQIAGVSDNHTSITLSSNVPTSFTNGNYQVLNTSTYKSGLQNGFFTLEQGADGYVGQPYYLAQGLYRFEYYGYLSIPMKAGTLRGYVGSDMFGKNAANATLNQFLIVSDMLTDTRIGDIVQTNAETITKDFNSLTPPKPDINTLMLLSFNSFPFTNAANIYTTASSQYIQSSASVNDHFDQAIVLTQQPLVIDNAGILVPQQQGTIEFWVNPLFDTGNDPNYRYYFDATSIASEKVVSINNATVKVAGRISSVIDVKLQLGFGSQNTDYFVDGTIAPDMQTIYLKRALPSQNTPVVVNYIPTGTQGDRISIFKDPAGYVNFNVIASGIDYNIRAPAYWTAGTWHRIKAQFIFNSGLGTDQLHFFMDGYERGNVLLNNGLLAGQYQVFGSPYIGPNGFNTAISFKDSVNELFIGSDYLQGQQAYALIDNLRISDISRPIFKPFGEALDVNYSSNLGIVYPVTTDLYTTLLYDFNTLVSLATNFSTLKNRYTGNYDFTVNIFDSFDIVKNDAKVKQVLGILINTLKPGNTTALINYKS